MNNSLFDRTPPRESSNCSTARYFGFSSQKGRAYHLVGNTAKTPQLTHRDAELRPKLTILPCLEAKSAQKQVKSTFVLIKRAGRLMRFYRELEFSFHSCPNPQPTGLLNQIFSWRLTTVGKSSVDKNLQPRTANVEFWLEPIALTRGVDGVGQTKLNRAKSRQT